MVYVLKGMLLIKQLLLISWENRWAIFYETFKAPSLHSIDHKNNGAKTWFGVMDTPVYIGKYYQCKHDRNMK